MILGGAYALGSIKLHPRLNNAKDMLESSAREDELFELVSKDSDTLGKMFRARPQ